MKFGNILCNMALGVACLIPGALANASVPVEQPGSIQVLGKCLEVPATGAILRHEVVRLADCDGGGPNQTFKLTADRHITILGWCLDIPNSNAVDHQVVQLFDCRDQLNQKFVTDNQNHLSVQGKCLDVPNSQAWDGVQIQLFDCRQQANQSFTFGSVYP